MKIKPKFLLYSTLVIILLVISGFSLHFHLLGKAFDARLANFKKEHQDGISQLVEQGVSPEKNSDIHAFVSTSTLNEILKVLVGQKYPISKTSSIEFSKIELSSDSGTPLIKLDGTIKLGNVENSSSVSVQGIATISPLSARNGNFYTRLQLVALQPTITTSGFKLAINGFFGDLLKSIGQEYLDKMPEFAIPVQQGFRIPVSGSDTPIRIPTRPPNSDVLSGVLHVKGFELSSALEVTRAHFLHDGLHLFLGIEGREKHTQEVDDSWSQLSVEKRMETLSEPNVDYFMRVNHEALNHMILKILSLSKETRTVSFVSNGLNGNFYYWENVHREPIFKTFLFREERKVYLENADSAKASVEVVNFKLENKPEALVGLSLEAALEGRVQLHWHYDPGPTGGVGGSVGVSIPRKAFKIDGGIRMIPSPTPKLEAFLDAPETITINVEVGLEKIGNIPFSQQVSLPKTTLFSTPIPSGIKEQIDFNVGSSQISRKIEIFNLLAKPTYYGLSISGNLKIESSQ